MRRLGFKRLDSTATVLPPALSRESRPRATIVEMTGPHEDYAGQLEPGDVRIYRDHRNFDCGHLLTRVGDETCYIVYSRIDRHLLPYCLIHYVSHRRLFAKHHAAIRSHLLRRTGSHFVVIDSRLLGDLKVPFSFRIRGNQKLFRSADVAPHEIDTLYSEMLLFGHTNCALRQVATSPPCFAIRRATEADPSGARTLLARRNKRRNRDRIRCVASATPAGPRAG